MISLTEILHQKGKEGNVISQSSDSHNAVMLTDQPNLAATEIGFDRVYKRRPVLCLAIT